MTGVMSTKSKRTGDSTGSELDGGFSRLDEMDDLQPFGHGVQVTAGSRPTSMNGDEGVGTDAEMPVPSRRIGVKTDVIVETSDRLTYNDRLY